MSNGDSGRFSQPPAAGGGGVSGLATANAGTAITDNKVVRGDGTAGIQGSAVDISDAGAVTGATLLDVDNLRLDGNTLSSTSGDIVLSPTGDVDFANKIVRNLNQLKSSLTDFWLRAGSDVRLGSALEIVGCVGNVETGGDVGMKRAAPGVWRDTDAAGGFGWRQWAGESYLAVNATNATATLANTGLSVTVKSGRKYTFKCILYVSDSTAAEGVQIDFGGGSATATNFRAHVTGFDTALTVNVQVTSLTTSASAGTFTGAGMIEVHGSLRAGSDGTFVPRFAQNTHAIGTLTLFEGSHLLTWDMP